MKQKINKWLMRTKNRVVGLLSRIWQWLRANIVRPRFLVCLAIAELLFWSPVIVAAVLAAAVSAWYWTAVAAIIAFWAGPFTPAVPLQIGLALLIERLIEKIHGGKSKNDKRANKH